MKSRQENFYNVARQRKKLIQKDLLNIKIFSC